MACTFFSMTGVVSIHTSGMIPPPKNIPLETSDDVVHYAALIERQAVRSHAMPPGNVTGLEPTEREILARWLADGDAPGLGRGL